MIINDAMDYWSQIRDDNDFLSIWSMYEVGLDANAVVREDLRWALEGGATLIYQDEKMLLSMTARPTWLELWNLVDGIIRGSGDEHHLFIEALTVKEDNTIMVTTGS